MDTPSGRDSWDSMGGLREKLSCSAGQAASADSAENLGAKMAKCWAFMRPLPPIIGCGPSPRD